MTLGGITISKTPKSFFFMGWESRFQLSGAVSEYMFIQSGVDRRSY